MKRKYKVIKSGTEIPRLIKEFDDWYEENKREPYSVGWHLAQFLEQEIEPKRKSELQDLKDEIADLVMEFKDNKISELDMDSDYEIYQECQSAIEAIDDHLEDLEATIDQYIEEMNEPSNYEFDCREDDKRHYENMIGG